MKRLAILGGGRAAWAYGSEWRKIGWPIAGVWLRDESRSRIADLLQTARRSIESLASDADLVLVAVSDRAVEEVAAMIPETDAIVFHASGALTSVRDGFSLHPLKSLPPVGEPARLDDALLVFEGRHRETASGIAAKIGARFAEVSPEHKILYHAGAVFGSNYVALMLDLAERLIGIDDARDDLVALAHSAIANWRAHRGPARFTGPAARGDSEVIARHLRALAVDPQLAQIYELLADRIAGSDPCEG
jgi:predicted short-subunit dehydrogenase-like oxidoreductase (DUF2520 family)